MEISISQSRRSAGKRTTTLQPRQGPPGGGGGGGTGNNTVLIIVAVVVVALIVAGTLTWTYLRRKRARGQTPKLLPGFLHKRWGNWKPKQKYATVSSAQNSRTTLNTNTAYNGLETEERAANNAAAAGVDRNTSVRSVMTLPAYSNTPRPEEQVLGREGEREGMDTVVEFPEAPEEEENRREDQMESLYQIRLQRRREVAEREERRRERREAREAGDFARLEQLRRDSRARANNQSTASLNGGLSVSAATMVAEHQSRSRDRRVSSVAYADVGHVRHDGTRIRANSSESERGGLLDNAAPMGDDVSSLRPSTTGRPRASSSALSISTNASDVDPPQHTPGTTQAGDSSHPHTSDGTAESSPTATRYTPESSTEGETDIGEAPIPPPATSTTITSPTNAPPEYQAPEEWGDAPAYSEQRASVLRRAQQQQQQAENTAAAAGGGMSRSNTQRAFDEMSRASTVGSVSRQTTGVGSSSSSTGAPRLPELNLPSISVEGASLPGSPVSPLHEWDAAGQRRQRERRMGGNEEFMS